MDKKLFPQIEKSISDLIGDEEGNVPRNKLVVIGSAIMLMGLVMGIDVFGAHSSHRSHSSHSSHSSTSYHRSHVSHTSHTSSSWHNSHASHSSSSVSGSGITSSGGGTGSTSAGAGSKAASAAKSGATVSVEIPKIQNPVSDKFVKSIPTFKSNLSLAASKGETEI
jgi:hypothetical protein